MVKQVNICTSGECGGECYKCRLRDAVKERDQALIYAFRWAEDAYRAGRWGPWLDNFDTEHGWLWDHQDAPWNK